MPQNEKAKKLVVNLISFAPMKTKRFQGNSILVKCLTLLFLSYFYMVQILQPLKKKNH